MAVYIDHVNLSLPGISSWQDALPLLTARETYDFDQAQKIAFKPTLLPPNERRRASDTVKLAFSICEPIYLDLAEEERQCQYVFASSGGDYVIFDKICRTLTTEERQVSPTLFHNSVHNAPAGYWSIATQSKLPANSIAADKYTVAMALLEAMVSVVTTGLPTLLVCYDICPPYPISEYRKIAVPFGFGLYLSLNQSESSMAKLNYQLEEVKLPDNTGINKLQALIDANPIASALPLLQLLALEKSGSARLACSVGQQLELSIKCLK